MRAQRKEYLTLRSANYIFVVFVIMVSAYFVFMKSDTPEVVIQTEKFVVPEVSLLTPEEVANERLKFVTLEEQTAVEKNVQVTHVVGQHSNRIQSGQNIVTSGSSEIGLSDTTGTKAVTIEEGGEFRSDEGVTVSNIAPAPEVKKYAFLDNSVQDKEVKNIQGSVYSKDKVNSVITISLSSGQLAIIRFDSDTNFIINSKNVSVDELRVSDKIMVEGLGSAASNYLEAKTVIVTGVTHIVPIN